ncbi:hypothetical protein K8I31_11220, partial [bacterium]|nr:hypothetical protein [bacterium]
MFDQYPLIIELEFYDDNNEAITIECLNPDVGEFSHTLSFDGYLFTYWTPILSKFSEGETPIVFQITDNGSPILSIQHIVKVTMYKYQTDEIICAQGYGGVTNNYSQTVELNKWSNKITHSWNALPTFFEVNVGGGTDRETYIATGDIDNDGVDEIITTFGPVTKEARPNCANMVIVYD